MRINHNFVLRQLGDNIYCIETIDKGMAFNRIVTFNSTAAYLWNSLYDREFFVEDVVESIILEYGVEKHIAKQDALDLMEKWKAAGLIIQ